MHGLIYPDIFGSPIKAFFTSKSLGVDIGKISAFLSLKTEDVYLPVQRHTDKVVTLRSDFSPTVADAVITQKRGLLIGVQVADCVPVLLSDRKRSVVAAVHAGWRGTASLILQKTIASMISLFNFAPEDICIALGPSIGGKCYEVGPEVKNAIFAAMGDGAYYRQSVGKYYIDLSMANTFQAMSMGVPKENIWISNICTHCNPDRFHSYRRHKNYSGRQGGFIGVF